MAAEAAVHCKGPSARRPWKLLLFRHHTSLAKYCTLSWGSVEPNAGPVYVLRPQSRQHLYTWSLADLYAAQQVPYTMKAHMPPTKMYASSSVILNLEIG